MSVPGWAVPPRVLLVDDEVNWRMSSKFLQVFGCTIDVAVDGVRAVERMNGEVRFSAHGEFLFRNR
jgi:osomolarity two-component system response regulator SKN7